jgi:hypothetical protein
MIEVPTRIPKQKLIGDMTGFNTLSAAIVGNIMAGVGVWWIIRQGQRLFASHPKTKKRPRMITVSPLLNLSDTGISVLIEF